VNCKKCPAFLKEISARTTKTPHNSTSIQNSNYPPVSTSQPSVTLQSHQSSLVLALAAVTANDTKSNSIDLHSMAIADKINIKEGLLKTLLAIMPLLLLNHE